MRVYKQLQDFISHPGATGSSRNSLPHPCNSPHPVQNPGILAPNPSCKESTDLLGTLLLKISKLAKSCGAEDLNFFLADRLQPEPHIGRQ